MADAFFRVEGDTYLPSALTRGPWDPDFQHAGPPVIKAGAWRLRTASIDLPAGLGSVDGPGLIGSLPSTLRPGFAPEGSSGASGASAGSFPETGSKVGYHTAMEYRFLSGAFAEPGPAVVWMRMRQPLVDERGER